MDLQQVMSEALELLQRGLAPLVESRLQRAEIDRVLPEPLTEWTSPTLLRVVLSSWDLFNDLLTPQDQRFLEILQQALERPEAVTRQQLAFVLFGTSEVLRTAAPTLVPEVTQLQERIKPPTLHGEPPPIVSAGVPLPPDAPIDLPPPPDTGPSKK